MVRLTSRSFLHLTPEIVDGEFELPFYAKILQLGRDEVSFRSLQGGDGKVRRAIAVEHVVTLAEVNKAERVSFLRRSVSVKASARVSLWTSSGRGR